MPFVSLELVPPEALSVTLPQYSLLTSPPAVNAVCPVPKTRALPNGLITGSAAIVATAELITNENADEVAEG